MKKIAFLCLFMAITPVWSQSNYELKNNYNGWLMYFGDHKFASKWGIHLEAQVRQNNYITSPQQLLLRSGINYHLNSTIFATAGYCYVLTYPYGADPALARFPENRIWEQLQLKHQSGKIELVNRYRIEQRSVQIPRKNSADELFYEQVYTNRFRLLTRVSIPLKGSEIKDKSWYISLYDELFVSFGKNVAFNVFDQNRAYLALGYKIPRVGRLEIGYLNQLIIKSNGIKVENNHTLQVGLISNFDLFQFQ